MHELINKLWFNISFQILRIHKRNKPQEETRTNLQTSLPEWCGEEEEAPGAGDSAGDDEWESPSIVSDLLNVLIGIRRSRSLSLSLSFSLVPIFLSVSSCE